MIMLAYHAEHGGVKKHKDPKAAVAGVKKRVVHPYCIFNAPLLWSCGLKGQVVVFEIRS